MNELTQYLIDEGILETPEIIQAFSEISREDFVPIDMKQFAFMNDALSIGFRQTISQPLVVAFMLEQLKPQKGQHILDIGAGSGWTTALLAHIVGDNGKVIGIEVISELARFGKDNITKYDFIEKGTVEFVCQNGVKGYAKGAPYNSIFVSASLPEKKIPQAWREQLKDEGTIITPIKDSIWKFTKVGEDEFTEVEYPGFVFVPFVN